MKFLFHVCLVLSVGVLARFHRDLEDEVAELLFGHQDIKDGVSLHRDYAFIKHPPLRHSSAHMPKGPGFEQELAAYQSKEEVRFVNKLSLPIYVKGEMDKTLLRKEVLEVRTKLEGTVTNVDQSSVSGSVEVETKQEKEYDYILRTAGFSKIAPGGGRDRIHFGSGSFAYITLYLILHGKTNMIKNAAQVENGIEMTISGNVEYPNIAYETEICHGPYKDCGCWGGYCMSYCSFGHQWCYTTQCCYSQNYKYKKCATDRDCSPHWQCAGPCSV